MKRLMFPRAVSLCGATFFALLLLAGSIGANASPVQVGLGAFGPGATIYSFDSSGSPPSIAGLVFAFPGYVSQQSPSSWFPDEPSFNTLTFQGMTVTFDVPVQQVGFYFGGNQPNLVSLDVGLGGSTTGNFSLTSAAVPADGVNNWIFYGFADPAGIDSLSFGINQNNINWVVGIGQLETVAAVPEPETCAMLLAGLGLLGFMAQRRKQKAA